mmetsp:Transcript_747/g.1786  ORF Transcript_747/g.1786 Transcript_747/m.1786 type:complete len:641 (-) Transcript_747:150-2072(-)|eukprot:CAMPEP_0170593896 /NCGR_PEP_ID=MMETSP0224-20130122/13706_1 /TAXON_ID=285029 /ORGANISM="Togula jolla, Strain CCCM 725" /LENGTH=640 /DNA_ID=CAMNT_0010917907 /DNA_START=33 /DNA_END=1955 /DNA_ORIENTATION=+
MKTVGNANSTPDSVLKLLGQLSSEELDEVRKRFFVNQQSQLEDPLILQTSAADPGNDASKDLADEPGAERPASEHVQSGSRESVSPPTSTSPLTNGSFNHVIGDPQVVESPSQMPTPSPMQARERRRRRRNRRVGAGPATSDCKEKDVVVVSSLSFDWEQLSKVPGVSAYELRLLWHLYMLRWPKLRMVFCTSQHVPPELINYYLRYLPGGVSLSEARTRLLMLSCSDAEERSVTEKLLHRPRAIQRIRNFISPEIGYMTCFNSTDSEMNLAKCLGIPNIGNGSSHSFWGTKVGSRQLFREAGLLHPDGSYEAAWDAETLANEVLALWRRHPEARKVMVKLNESFSGDGNAVLWLGKALRKRVMGKADADAARAIQEAFDTELEFMADSGDWPSYSAQIQKLGAICELYIEGAAEMKTSPSVQIFIDINGKAEVFATHEQWLNGQIYVGCHFPANSDYAADLVVEGECIGRTLASKGVLGYAALDFVSVRQPAGTYEHHAIEINVRMGGTTLPIMTMGLLCAQGRFDKETSNYYATDGTPRYYTALDTLQKPAYRGLLTADLLDIVRKHSETIEWNRRPNAPETGVIFHLVPLLSELGKVGVLCIGRSREEATSLYDQVVEILDEETAHGLNGGSMAHAP